MCVETTFYITPVNLTELLCCQQAAKEETLEILDTNVAGRKCALYKKSERHTVVNETH